MTRARTATTQLRMHAGSGEPSKPVASLPDMYTCWYSLCSVLSYPLIDTNLWLVPDTGEGGCMWVGIILYVYCRVISQMCIIPE